MVYPMRISRPNGFFSASYLTIDFVISGASSSLFFLATSAPSKSANCLQALKLPTMALTVPSPGSLPVTSTTRFLSLSSVRSLANSFFLEDIGEAGPHGLGHCCAAAVCVAEARI